MAIPCPVDPLERIKIILEATSKNSGWMGPLGPMEVQWLIDRVQKKDYEPGKAMEKYKR